MSVLFDPFLDQQRAYQLSVNGYGVQSDELVNADGSRGASRSRSPQSRSSGGSRGGRSSGGGSGLSNSGQFGIRGDRSWDALYETRGRMVEDGWTAEMAIPFKSLRYPALAGEGGRRWGFQITRVIRGKSEAQSWSPVSRGVAGQLTQFGVLEGLADLSQSRNLEILPELTGARLGALDTSSGGFDSQDPFGDLGVSVKYGITPNLTADMTYNPDFSQIESDQAADRDQPALRALLSRAAPVLPRRAGDLPDRHAADPAAHPDHRRPRAFGGKLTGKVGRTTLGVIVADDEAAGRLDDSAHPRFGTTAQTFVGRARYDLYPESYVGAIMTAREFGHDYNRVGGIDGRFRLGTHAPLQLHGRRLRDPEHGVRLPQRTGVRGRLHAPGAQPELRGRLRQRRSRVLDRDRLPAPLEPASGDGQRGLSLVAGVDPHHLGADGQLPAALRSRWRAAGRAGPGAGQLPVSAQHLGDRQHEPRSRAFRGGRLPEERVRRLRRHQLAARVDRRRHQPGRRDSVQLRRLHESADRQPLPARDPRRVDDRQLPHQRPALVALAVGPDRHLQPPRRSHRRVRRGRRQDLPDAHYLPIHRPAAAALHPRAQHVQARRSGTTS